MKNFRIILLAILVGMLMVGCAGKNVVQNDVKEFGENEVENVAKSEAKAGNSGQHDGLKALLDQVRLVVKEKKMVSLPDTETQIPIIMYHYVRVVDKNKDPLGYNLSINPEDFEKQMKYLKEQGYTSLHLQDLIDGKVPKKAIVLSFDDGLEDFYTTALPILKKYEFTASNAVITGMIGAHEHMTEQQIRECIEAGIEITAHSVNHYDLAKISAAELGVQLIESKNYLEKTFGLEVVGFIYPSGKYNDEVVREAASAGYKIAATTQYGEADLAKDELLLLPRIRIDNRDGYKGFVKKLEAVR